MATRITTTRTTTTAPAQSADETAASHADFTFDELVQAYFDCRRTKRNTRNALAFEQDLERNLIRLHEELACGTYTPGRSICFVVTRPKPREVWAADFRDRIVHHLLYNRIAPRFYASFIADTCACIPGRGTLYAARRLESKVRSITQNWKRPAYYLKCDLSNFFVTIDKRIVLALLAARIQEPWWRNLAKLVLFHDPRTNYVLRGSPSKLSLVPAHKRLLSQPVNQGLPIGNLSSQFFANVLMDALDQHIKHRLRVRYYVRYVDDFVLLHDSPMWLNSALADIRAYLPAALGLHLNDSKTVLQPISRGIDFVGHVIKPWRRQLRRRTINEAVSRLAQMPVDDLYESANSYFGLARQATHSHHDRTRLANVARSRGYCVNRALTQVYS